jgi:hypothetical protein
VEMCRRCTRRKATAGAAGGRATEDL